jgi:hypothetical protein
MEPTEGCLSEKISILISAEGSTVERRLPSQGCGFRLFDRLLLHVPSREISKSLQPLVPGSPDPDLISDSAIGCAFEMNLEVSS